VEIGGGGLEGTKLPRKLKVQVLALYRRNE